MLVMKFELLKRLKFLTQTHVQPFGADVKLVSSGFSYTEASAATLSQVYVFMCKGTLLVLLKQRETV